MHSDWFPYRCEKWCSKIWWQCFPQNGGRQHWLWHYSEARKKKMKKSLNLKIQEKLWENILISTWIIRVYRILQKLPGQESIQRLFPQTKTLQKSNHTGKTRPWFWQVNYVLLRLFGDCWNCSPDLLNVYYFQIEYREFVENVRFFRRVFRMFASADVSTEVPLKNLSMTAYSQDVPR